MHAAIERDRDFGRVLALSSRTVARRVVRALPASAEDLRDAMQELTAVDRADFDAIEHIVASLREWIDAIPADAETSVDLSLVP